MYAKIFESIYEGTLSDNWKALVTFQQLLILSNKDGVVDMTPSAISRTTGIPLDIIKEGIDALEQPDLHSRSKDMEGRRIVRLDSHRDWGWFIVNHEKYSKLFCQEDKREADKIRISKKRSQEKSIKSDMSQSVAECRNQSQKVADVAHVYVYVDVDSNINTNVFIPTESEKTKIDPLAELSPPACLQAAKETRLRIVTQDATKAFNAILGKPHGQLAAVHLVNEVRQNQVKRCLSVAKQICEILYKSSTVLPEFWTEYFEQCSKDAFLSGNHQGGKGHENWQPDFEFLTRKEQMTKVFDKAMSEAA